MPRPSLAIALVLLAACDARDMERPENPCLGRQAITIDPQAGEGLPDKTLALTFDDGPAESTLELSAFLKDEGVAATFFVNGMHVPGREDILEQLVADGHLIGNHTESHAALTTLSAKAIVAEVEATDRLLAPFVPKEKLFFRPPYGDWSADVHRALTSSAMNKYKGPVGWDIGDALTDKTAADWDCWDDRNGTLTVAQCGALYLEEIGDKKRGIVLLHDGPPGGHGDKTLAMMRLVIPKLKAEGYRFVRIDSDEKQAKSGELRVPAPKCN